MNFLKKNELFIKPITDRLSRFLPECGVKDKLRCWFYNLLNADFKMHVLKSGELQIDTRGVSFRVAKVPAFEVGNDLIFLRGHLVPVNDFVPRERPGV